MKGLNKESESPKKPEINYEMMDEEPNSAITLDEYLNSSEEYTNDNPGQLLDQYETELKREHSRSFNITGKIVDSHSSEHNLADLFKYQEN